MSFWRISDARTHSVLSVVLSTINTIGRKEWRDAVLALELRSHRSGFMTETRQPPTAPDSDQSLRGAAHLFNLASNPLRLRILVSLVDGACSVEDLCLKLGRDRRLVNQYVQALAQAKLVQNRRQGRSHIYESTQSGHQLIDTARALSELSQTRRQSGGHVDSPLHSDVGSLPHGQTEPLPQFVDILKILADPIRLRLLNLLSGKPDICVCHLHEALALAPSTVSRHLKTLRQAGLIVGRRHGTWVYYRLALPCDDFNTLLARYLDQDLSRSQLFVEDRKRLSRLCPCADA